MSRFDYVKYDGEATKKGAKAKMICEDLDAWMLSSIKLDAGPAIADAPFSEAARYVALARTALEGVYMNIGKALRDEQRTFRGAVPQEGRNNE